MKNKNTSANVDSTGVSEWWFTRNIIVGLLAAFASVLLGTAFDQGTANATNQTTAEQPPEQPTSNSLAQR
jgi:hypothetical protein